MHPYRTHTCGELRPSHVDCKVRLSGWVHRVRDHGGIVFIDLRDHYDITQIVIHPEKSFYQGLQHWRLETVLCVTGTVARRSPDTVNAKIATGEVELVVESLTILSRAETLPFPVADETPCPERTRLKYRFLDLRREQLHKNILLRSKIISRMRELMNQEGFTEFQTPILGATTPEGARDYLVPSRLHPGKFYALPQAPQISKQLLMAAGFDRYFQIAPCFRDEDSRADRSPGEFYQLDIELSFATEDDIFGVVERVMTALFAEFSNAVVTPAPFPRIPYRQAMSEFGCDKPDLRNPLRLLDVSAVFAHSNFKAFAGVVRRGGVVRAIKVTGIVDQSRKFFDDMITFAQSVGAGGLAYIGWKDGRERSPIAKFLNADQLNSLRQAGDISEGDVMFFIADTEAKASAIGAAVIAELGKRLDLLEKDAYRFCWIVDYPMFELDEEEKIIFSHNPFSMPQGGLDALNNQPPLEILAHQYDLVCNGTELSSGAIRNHLPDVMTRAFEIAGYDPAVIEERFPALINAFRLGTPPHGGIAPGVDRIIMLLANTPNLREITAFPLNQQAQDLMTGAPSTANPRQLRDLHLQIQRPEKKEKNTSQP